MDFRAIPRSLAAAALGIASFVGTTALASAASPLPAGFAAPLPQNGDRAGEEQPMVDRNFEVPAAPPLSVEQAIASFTLPEGYRIQAVAQEPLIHDPVDIAFDARGRLWVIEMSQLMLDADATGELDPKCAIAVLSDTDADGIYDQREEFASELVLPRSVCFVGDGVLAILPPEIVYLRDTDGDGRADSREVVDRGIGAGLSNPEHAANGLTLGIDNWIYLANHGKRYRLGLDGSWQIDAVPQVGQWGLGEDAWGRRIYNYNSAPVHGDLVPTHYLVRNPELGRAQGVNARWAHDTRVWTGRVNTGVNRGYQKNTLAEDGRLARYTAACGPEVYTGTRLAASDHGDVFVCEPSGNMLRQLRMRESEGRPSGENAYGTERTEFLVSTDERFRPVNLANGPDGALYVVDLYRGILQHKVFLTSFLRRQIEERGLDKHTGLGRIWRIVHESSEESEPSSRVDYTRLDGSALVQCFHEPNAWVRKTAQATLVARAMRDGGLDAATVQALERASGDRESAPLARLHALWTLEGIGALRQATVLEGLEHESHPKLLAQLIRLGEAWADEPATHEAWQWLMDHDAAEVRWQLGLSLGESTHPTALGQMVQMLARHPQDAILRTGVISGARGREATLLDRVLAHPLLAQNHAGQAVVARELARCIVRGADGTAIRRLAERTASVRHTGLRLALMQGMADGVPKNPGDKRYRFAAAEPAALERLAASQDSKLLERLAHLRARLSWSAEAEPAPELSPEHTEAIASGLRLYAETCGACHQSNGEGLAGLAPPLADSEWLAKPTPELASIALFGLSGPIEVRGETWNLTMPGWAQLSDQELADVLSYVTAEWGPEPRHVAAEELARVRSQQ